MSLTDPLRELLGFLGAYLSLGVVGLRYGVLGRAQRRAPGDTARAHLFRAAGRRAAGLGLAGVLLATGLLIAAATRVSAARHTPLVDVLARGQGEAIVALVCYALAIVGFGLVLARIPAAWHVAAVGALGAALVNVLSLRWAALVNPVHVLAGSLWIGTLFALMTIAIPTVQAGTQSGDDKALTIAEMVHAFSPMALVAVAVLVVTGVVTAVRHLKFVAALWTTSYGIALVVKLCVVAMVLAAGAWNWRRVRPGLGTPGAADRLRRSARLELAFAGLVLLVTSVLVSLPSPKLPR
ncbi:MAG TPA: CopD family protein [Gemmatimonadaceae bacterium]|nr:CopD family protein [Gemmatimonadaceae bacterium]